MGTSLVLDEFALILHLQDVYWADEGRISVEMVSLAMGCLGLAVVGLTPFDFSGFEGGFESVLIVGAVVATILGLIVVSVMKGKYKLGLVRHVVPLCRGAARPSGVAWAKRRYGPEKVARAMRRTASYDERFGPATGGSAISWPGSLGTRSRSTAPAAAALARRCETWRRSARR